MGRFEAKLLAALLLAVVMPFISSLVLVRMFVDDTIAVGVNDEMRSYLEGTLSLYPDFFRADKLLGDDQASRLAEAPEVIALSVEAEGLLGAPAPAPARPEEEPPPAPSEEPDAVLILVPEGAEPSSLPAPPEEPPAPPTSGPLRPGGLDRPLQHGEPLSPALTGPPEEFVLTPLPASGPAQDPEPAPASAPASQDAPDAPRLSFPDFADAGALNELRASFALAQALEEARRRIGIRGEVRILDGEGRVMARLPALDGKPPEGARVRQVRRSLWRPVGAAVALEVEFSLASFYFEDFQRGEQTIYPVYRELTGSLDELKRSFFWAYLLVLGGIVALASIGGAVFARRITGRVTALISATQQVGQGDLSVSVQARGRDEIADLARSFNHMVEEVKESRARVLYLERIGAWKEIARRLAHEIKNPLTPIRLAVQQLRSSYKGDDPRFSRLVREVDEIVDEEVSSLRSLVEEFSEFARLPDIAPIPEDLSAFARELCEQNPRFAEGVALVCHPGPALIVSLDRRAMRRAVINLVKNAAEAIHEHKGKGTVTVSTRPGDKGRALLVVEDDGPGIPPDLRDKIFEPYYTSKEHGTGLGLAIVKRTVFEHQGELEVLAREGGGAIFLLTFPLAPGQDDAS